MASRDFVLMFVLVFAVVLPITSFATEYIVGDEIGWTKDFDYQAWAKGKTFLVGDKLVFKYSAGAHNVFKVSGSTFKNCTVPALREALTTGNDTILLASPGRKWYICGVGQHCALGQKLAITVWPLATAAPSPTPAPSAAPAPSPTPAPSAAPAPSW